MMRALAVLLTVGACWTSAPPAQPPPMTPATKLPDRAVPLGEVLVGKLVVDVATGKVVASLGIDTSSGDHAVPVEGEPGVYRISRSIVDLATRRITAAPPNDPTPEQTASRDPVTHDTSRRFAFGELVLAVRYDSNSDSGAHVTASRDGMYRWELDAAPLGVGHSEYYHLAYAERRGDRFVLVSQGSYGWFVEVHDLATGKLLDRHQSAPLGE